MTKQIIADLVLDLAALVCFCLLIYADKLTPGEGLPPLLLILGIKTASQLRGGPRTGGVATLLAVLSAVGSAPPPPAPQPAQPDADTSGEHRPSA